MAAHDHVTLVPAAGAFLATYWPDRTAEGDVRVYGRHDSPAVGRLDPARRGPPTSTWSGRDDGTVFVDDEDEFAEHRVALATRLRWCRAPFRPAQPC
ncbi:MAG: hypothetical protein R2734_14805 [Nocardioides sp.]